MSRLTTALYGTFLIALLGACSVDLSPSEQPLGPGGDQLVHVENDDGSLTTTVDASDEQAWVYLDLDTAQQVPEGSQRWDLAFNRMNIIGNGASGVVVAWVAGNDTTAVPDASEFVADPEDRELAKAEGVFQTTDPNDPTGPGAWYAYEIASHTLTPRERVYFVKSDEGALFALIFLDYYDEARSPAQIKFRWVEIPQ